MLDKMERQAGLPTRPAWRYRRLKHVEVEENIPELSVAKGKSRRSVVRAQRVQEIRDFHTSHGEWPSLNSVAERHGITDSLAYSLLTEAGRPTRIKSRVNT